MKRHVRGYVVGALVLAVLWPAAQLWPGGDGSSFSGGGGGGDFGGGGGGGDGGGGSW